MVAKAPTLGADAIILDLEDSVPINEKPGTRPIVRQAVDDLTAAGQRQVFVRVNPYGAGKNAFSQDFAPDDIVAVVCDNLAGLVLPKTESAEELLAVDNLLAELEADRGMAVGSIEVEPILETAKGIVNAMAIATACPRRVKRVSIGAGDLTMDLGVEWTRDETEIFYGRAHLVMVSRAAGLEPPMDGVYNKLDDIEGLERSARLAKQLGFQGKQCVHPSQIPVLNAVFGPTPAQVEYARRAVAAFDQAVAEGKASIMFEGKMLDYPIVEAERNLLARAKAIEARQAQLDQV
jgi:citrate lyase subunit beta/citryl-CoA lyase